MEKERIYRSDHVIGKMYRSIRIIHQEYKEKNFCLNLNYSFRYDRLLYGFEIFIMIASELLYDYYMMKCIVI